MPPRGAQYTLVGFAPDLDWRPLRFVQRIPPNRICLACGLVCRTTALLPCMHLLCQSCYEHCTLDGEHVCPLDGHYFQDRDVDWKETPTDEILRKQVSCWNDGSGCEAVVSASEISRHFQHECGHHSICCPKCSATVLCRDVCAHLRSNCNELIVPVKQECDGRLSCKNGVALLSSFRRALEQQACETRTFLERLFVENSPCDERLSEICHSINASREALKEELSHGISNLNDSLKIDLQEAKQDQKILAVSAREIATSNEEIKERLKTQMDAIGNISSRTSALDKTLKRSTSFHAETGSSDSKLLHIVAAIERSKAEAKENHEKTMECIKKVLRHAELGVSYCVFFVPAVKSLQETAVKVGYVRFYSAQTYLCGYCVSPGLRFHRKGSSVSLCVCLSLHKGDMDDFIQWPLEHKIRLSIIHPKDGAEHTITVKPYSSAEALKRPLRKNVGAWFPAPSPDLDDLIRDGYVENDQLRVKWELLP